MEIQIKNTAVLILVLFFVFLIPISVSHASTLKAPLNGLGLVGYWTFDGNDTNWNTNTVSDASGNGNTGTLVNMGTTTSPVIGKMGQALSFNGVNQYIDTGNSSSLNVSLITVNMWVKVPATPASTQSIAGKWNGSTGLSWLLTITTGGDYKFFTGDGNSGNGAISTIKNGRFQMVTGVYDGTNTKIYVDGVWKNNAVNPLPPDIITNNLLIGTDAFNRNFDGKIDDVRIYNRALSAREIKQLYNAGAVSTTIGASPKTVFSNDLVGYWTFDGNDTNWNTNTVSDASGNGNTGTLVNMGTTTSPVIGKMGQALSFNGVDTYIHRTTFNNVPSSYMTISAWVKTTSATLQLVLAQGRRPATVNGEYLYSIQANGKQLFWDYNGNYGYSSSSGYSNTSVADNKWHNIIFVKNGINGTYYLDGKPDGTKIAAGDRSYITSDFVIGEDYRGKNDLFNGKIDDVRIYNRAFSSAEIKQLYNAGAVNTTIGASPKTVFSNSLVSYWTFDGQNTNWNTNTTADTSGNGNTGTLVNMSTTTSPVIGKMGQALSFNGVNQYVYATGGATNKNSQAGTLSAWVKLNTIGGTIQTIYAMKTAHSYRGVAFFVNTDGRLGYWIRIGSNPVYLYSSSALSAGTWYYVTLVQNGTTGGTFYINGVSNGSIANTGWFGDLVDPYTYDRIGYGGYSADSLGYFKGAIDDMRIYNRALSAKEIKQLYNKGR